MVVSAATWRRDDIQTHQNIKVDRAGAYVVCWSSTSASSDLDFRGTAGILLVTDAPAMGSANLYLSTVEPMKVAPIVVSFQTGDNLRYRDAVDSMQMRIVFRDPNKLMP